MRLLHITTLRLSMLAAFMLTFWSVFFYFTMMDEITDEIDDSLEDYAEMIIVRSLRNDPLPRSANGTNNYYYQREVSADYARHTPHISYADRNIYLDAKKEIEPARVLTYIYMRDNGSYVELVVATPNIDKADLREAIAFWIAFLYVMLMLSIVAANLWGIRHTMRPLTKLLAWLDSYRLGQINNPLNNPTRIHEFKRLNETVERSMKRGEELYEQQKVFVGNASHEMQTPIAVCQNRIELLIDEDGLSEQQMGELLKIKSTLGRLARLNKSLLLLCKIEHGQYDEAKPQYLAQIIQSLLPDYEMVYASQGIRTQVQVNNPFEVMMDESMAITLVSNLLKNAYVHNVPQGRVQVQVSSQKLVIRNTGQECALDEERIFQRFYHAADKQNSTGLGLALVEAICKRNALNITYRFEQGYHVFELRRHSQQKFITMQA